MELAAKEQKLHKLQHKINCIYAYAYIDEPHPFYHLQLRMLSWKLIFAPKFDSY